jgi:predicted acetyltransferase
MEPILEIRPITAANYEAHKHIVSLAFARGKTPEFTPDVYEQTDRTRIGVYENGRLQAALGILDYQFFFGDDRRPCGGIFGVASDPAMRGRGYAGALIKRSLEIMREKGQYLSSLWPFDFRYYRRYGWEWTGETRNCVVPLELLPSGHEADHVEGVYEDVIRVLAPLYERKAAQYNGMLARDSKRWEQRTTPVRGRQRAAYVYRRDGGDEGFAILHYGDKDDELRADDIVALTRRAYEGLLGVARRHAMTAKKLMWSAPEIDIFPSILTHWDVETKLEPAGMGRVVDAAAALRALRPPPSLTGEAIVLLSDEHAPWNAGTWRIVVEGSGVDVQLTDRNPGITLDIQALTQAYWGTPSLLDLRRWERIEVRDEAQFAVWAALLPPMPVWLNDDF